MTYTHYEHDTKSIFLINMIDELTKPWSELVKKWLTKFLREWKNIAILVNKKWYASWTLCNDCWFIPRCKNCDVAIAIHEDVHWWKIWLCHICRMQYTADAVCTNCWWTDTTTYGLWTQQVAQRIKETYNVEALVLENSSANSLNKSEKMLAEVSQARVVVWTTLLIQPITWWSPDAFIVLNADIWLNVPDFQAHWNNFSLLYDCFTKLNASTFLVQTYNSEAPSITHACNLDLEWMKKHELAYREQYKYPPYNEMCVLLYKNEIEEKLFTTTNKLFQELLYIKEQYEMNDLEIYTTPPMIYKMYGKYRYSIILKWSQVRQFMDIAYSKLKIATRWFKVDWEPQQLL